VKPIVDCAPVIAETSVYYGVAEDLQHVCVARLTLIRFSRRCRIYFPALIGALFSSVREDSNLKRNLSRV
jgi:hypothetical protein